MLKLGSNAVIGSGAIGFAGHAERRLRRNHDDQRLGTAAFLGQRVEVPAGIDPGVKRDLKRAARLHGDRGLHLADQWDDRLRRCRCRQRRREPQPGEPPLPRACH